MRKRVLSFVWRRHLEGWVAVCFLQCRGWAEWRKGIPTPRGDNESCRGLICSGKAWRNPVQVGLEARLLDLSLHHIEVRDFSPVPPRLWVWVDYTWAQSRVQRLSTTCHSPSMTGCQKNLFWEGVPHLSQFETILWDFLSPQLIYNLSILLPALSHL